MERVRYAATSIQRFRRTDIGAAHIFLRILKISQNASNFDGKEISREALAHHTELCLKAADRMMSEGFESPTEFELVTAVGLSYFAEEKADFVILEVGLGGKGDSTNICDKPIVTAITSIAFDHMAQLGNTLELIAADKAGILKADVPAVVCVPDAGPMEVIRARAKELRAPLIDVTKFRVENIRGRSRRKPV